MADAKVVSLSVRPMQASNLCFEADGILGDLDTQLGAAAPLFDFNKFFTILGSFPTVSSDASRLLYDPTAIQGYVKSFRLAALRAQARKAALDKAINQRQNAYYSKYGNEAAIIAMMNKSYSPSSVNSKPYRLQELATLSQTQVSQLATAYWTDGRTGVVKNTKSVLQANSQGTTTTHETGQSNEIAEQLGVRPPLTMQNPPAGGGSWGESITGNDLVQETFEDGTSGATSTSQSVLGENQTIVNTDYGYRVPYLESQAQYQRAQISLIDQQFAQFMAGQNLPNLAQVFKNELNSIDSDINRLQIGFLNTILMSPIGGTVTAIYKNPGDAVQAGEPVLRVENLQVVLLTAVLVYRGSIQIGATATVQTTLYDAAGPATVLTGNVVAVRGQSSDDRWTVVIQCNNLDSASNPIFPSGYRFDSDDTTVTIS